MNHAVRNKDKNSARVRMPVTDLKQCKPASKSSLEDIRENRSKKIKEENGKKNLAIPKEAIKTKVECLEQGAAAGR